MKIQIDTVAKTIKLDQSAKLTELFKIVQKFLPNGEWKEYSIEANTVIYNWGYPIYQEPYRITCNPLDTVITSSTASPMVTTGITCFNIETN